MQKIDDCRKKLKEKNYKAAILSCDEAIAEDPSNRKAEELRRDTLSQLRKSMKLIYDDSVLEEQFGNIEAAKEKWDQIIKEDIPSDEYYKKARRKLKKYGGGI